MSSDAPLLFVSSSMQMHDYGVTVSISGPFNPASLQPAWLANAGILSLEEAQNPKDYFAQPDFVRFATDSLVFEASRDALEVTTRSPGSEESVYWFVDRLLDGLPQPPMTEISIARYGHVALDAGQHPVDILSSAFESVNSSAESDPHQGRFGNQSWRHLVVHELWDSLMSSPRLDELTMRGDRKDGRPGGVLITVEPSLIVPGGAFLAHIDTVQMATFPSLGDDQPPASTGAEARALLKLLWPPTRDEAFKTFEALTSALTRGQPD